jgi:hypothetical protein
MTGEIAPKTSERSAVWVPYVGVELSARSGKPVVPLVTDVAGGVRRPRSSVWYWPLVGWWPEPRMLAATAA